MPLSSLLTSGIETLSNVFLSLDERSFDRRKALNGRVLAVRLRPLPSLYFVISDRQLDVLGQFEGECDCELNLAVSALPRLSEPDAVVALIKEETLDIKGDIRLAQQFADLFVMLEPDLEEKLSRYIGDGPAHLLTGHIQSLVSGISDFLRRQAAQLGEAVVEEYQLAVGRCEYQMWQGEVRVLKAELAKLSERIDRLHKK